MLTVKATYEDGKITASTPLPQGKKQVMVTFLEEELTNDLNSEWHKEIHRRFEKYQETGEVIDGEKFFDELEKEIS